MEMLLDKSRKSLKSLLAGLMMILYVNPTNAQNTESHDREMQLAMERITNDTIPGISIALANKEGLLWSGTDGYSDLAEQSPVSQSHLFGIGDVSSQFVATLIAQMIENGFIDPNATPVSILGNVVGNIENADQATLKQLLNHTSGIYSWSDDRDWKRRGRGIQLNPSYRWRKDEQLKYASIEQHPATSKPGAHYNYSKTNYTILGLIAEQVSGGYLEVEIQNQILEPNNLNDTFFDTYQSLPSGKLVGSYHMGTSEFISQIGINANFEFGPGTLINTTGTTLSSEGLSSGMASTPRDVAIFLARLWNGDIISKNYVDMFKPLASDGSTSIHSETLGFTIDVRQVENTDLVLVSAVNIGIVDTGESPTATFIKNYVDDILVPVAKKYAQAN